MTMVKMKFEITPDRADTQVCPYDPTVSGVNSRRGGHITCFIQIQPNRPKKIVITME